MSSSPTVRRLLIVTAFIALTWAPAVAQTTGGKIIFADEFGRLLIINADGSGQTVLTAGGASNRDNNPVFSPDGSKIACDRSTSTGQHIVVMNADGTNPVTIINAASSSSINYHPTWSADGKKIAFSSNRNGGLGRGEIFVINVDGSGLTQLTTNMLMPTAGSDPFYSSDFDPTWSPDGSKIAFASSRISLANFEIFVMNADGTNPTRVTNLAENDRNPTWSPNSQRIASWANAGARRGITIINSDGTNPVTITGDGFSPAWSPDGTRLAMARLDPAIGFKPAIFIINVDGTNAVKITNNTFDSNVPSWAPGSAPPITTATISGRVLDGNGAPVSAATLSLTGTFSRTTQTDATGAYAFTGLAAGTYSISISKAGLGFTPATVNFNNLTSDQTANFTAFVVFSISGKVTGLGFDSISVNLSGSQTRNVLTDINGNYSFDQLPAGGNYTVAINTQIWNITPSSYTFNNLSANQTANFSASGARYTISGRITRLGNPLPGVTVAIENGSGFTPPTTTTDANGQYSFTNVAAGGSYVIRPSAANYRFDPPTRDFNVLNGNKTAADFIALSTNNLLFTTRYVFAGEGECDLVLTVVRGGNAGGVGPITVHYATSDGTATAGSDYIAVSGDLSFPEGTFQRTITIPFLSDQITENPETFSINLSNPTGQVDLADPSSVTVVLTDPAPPAPLVVATEPNSDRAIAINSTNFLAGPFKTSTPINFSSDNRTRVSFFVSGMQFNACQGTNTLLFEARDSRQSSTLSTVEGVYKLPGNNPYLQFNLILPQGLFYGDVLVTFRMAGLVSNNGRITTQP